MSETGFGYGSTFPQVAPCYYFPHEQPTAERAGLPASGFTDFRLRVDVQTHLSCFPPLFFIISRAAIPVRVRRRIVTILARQPSIPAVVQVPETPRTTNAGAVGTIESRPAPAYPN